MAGFRGLAMLMGTGRQELLTRFRQCSLQGSGLFQCFLVLKIFASNHEAFGPETSRQSAESPNDTE